MLARAKPATSQIRKLKFQFFPLHKVQYYTTTMGNRTSSEPLTIPISDYSKFVQDLVHDNHILVFSKTGCPYCTQVKQIFRENRVDSISWIELDQRKDGSKIQEVLKDMTGAGTVPRVFINGECIGGASDTEKLHKENKLMEKIQGCKDQESDR